MFPEYVQFLAFYVVTVALLKLLAAALDHGGNKTLAAGLGWFVPGLA